MKDKYFESEEFLALLDSYTKATAQGGSIYLDAEDFCDIADYYLQQAKPDEALAAADRGLHLHGDDDELRTVKSSVLIYQHDYKTAEAVLDTCVDQRQSDVIYQRAQLQYALYNNVEAAEEMFHDWIAQENENNRWETDVTRREELARDCYIHIISSFIELVENHQYDEELVYRWVEDYVVTFEPIGNYESDLMLADIVREEGMLDMVIRVFGAILETNPYVNRGYSIYASAQFAAGDLSAAIESADYALAIDPDDTEALLTKAHSFMSLENYEDAERLFFEYIETHKDDSQCSALAYCYIYQDKDELAYTYLQRAESYVRGENLDPLLTSQAYGELAEGYLAVEKPEEAMRCVSEVFKLAPDNFDAYFVRGTVYLMLENPEAAVEDFYKFITAESQDRIVSMCMMFQRLLMFKYYQVALDIINYYELQLDPPGIIDDFLPYKAACLFQVDDTTIQDFLDVLRLSCERRPDETKAVLGKLFPDNLSPHEYCDHMLRAVDTVMEKMGHINAKNEE